MITKVYLLVVEMNLQKLNSEAGRRVYFWAICVFSWQTHCPNHNDNIEAWIKIWRFVLNYTMMRYYFHPWTTLIDEACGRFRFAFTNVG